MIQKQEHGSPSNNSPLLAPSSHPKKMLVLATSVDISPVLHLTHLGHFLHRKLKLFCHDETSQFHTLTYEYVLVLQFCSVNPSDYPRFALLSFLASVLSFRNILDSFLLVDGGGWIVHVCVLVAHCFIHYRMYFCYFLCIAE